MILYHNNGFITRKNKTNYAVYKNFTIGIRFVVAGHFSATLRKFYPQFTIVRLYNRRNRFIIPAEKENSMPTTNENFRAIGYKSNLSCAVLILYGLISASIAVIMIKQKIIVASAIFIVSAIVCAIYFFSAVFRPDEIIYLSENSLKIFVRGKAKVIPLTEIVSLNYNRIMFATSMSKLGAGHLYVATADKTYTVGYVRSVRSAYEEPIIAVDRKKPFSGNPAE